MQQLLVDVTGKPFPQLMKEIVLDKIGMRHSTFEQPLSQAYTAQAASGHRPCGKPVAGHWHTYPEMAAAGLWTTPSDLARFAIELLRSGAGQSNEVLSAEMAKHMLTPQIEVFGLGGMEIKDVNGSTRFAHPGWNESFRSFMFAYTGSGQGAVARTIPFSSRAKATISSYGASPRGAASNCGPNRKRGILSSRTERD